MGEPGPIVEKAGRGFPLVVPLYWAMVVLETVVGSALVLGIAIG